MVNTILLELNSTGAIISSDIPKLTQYENNYEIRIKTLALAGKSGSVELYFMKTDGSSYPTQYASMIEKDEDGTETYLWRGQEQLVNKCNSSTGTIVLTVRLVSSEQATITTVPVNITLVKNTVGYGYVESEPDTTTSLAQGLNDAKEDILDIISGDISVGHALEADVAEYAKEPWRELNEATGELHTLARQSDEQTSIMAGETKVPHAIEAEHSLEADHSTESDHATNADHALNSDHSTDSDHALTSDHSLTTDAAKAGSELKAWMDSTDNTLLNKIDKDLSTLPNLLDIGDNDLILIRSGSSNYKFTGSQLKEFAANPNKLFLGTFDSLISFKTSYPTGTEGQYAFVNELNEDSTNSLNMYVWDVVDSEWHREGAGVYVSYSVYNELEKRIIAREEHEDDTFITLDLEGFDSTDFSGVVASKMMKSNGDLVSVEDLLAAVEAGGYDDTDIKKEISDLNDAIDNIDLSSAVNEAKTYTDSVASTTLTDSKAYTDSKASSTLTDSKTYTDTKVAALVDSAPGTLDTLQELATALGDDPNFATTVLNKISDLEDEVDTKVEGKYYDNGSLLITPYTKPTNLTVPIIAIGNSESVVHVGIVTSEYAQDEGFIVMGIDNIANSYSGGSMTMHTSGNTGAIGIGYGNEIKSPKSVTVGRENGNSGGLSAIYGILNTSTGDKSAVIGYENSATSTGNVAIGYKNTITTTNSSSAIGCNNKASASNELLYGVSAFGYGNTASEGSSSAFGYSNTAAGSASAFGYSNNASSSRASAFGYNNTGSNSYASAFGYSNTASGQYSSAFGRNNTASGSYSSAFGNQNTATSNYSSSFGSGNTTGALYSASIGYNNSNTGNYSYVFGYNVANTSSGTASAQRIILGGSGTNVFMANTTAVTSDIKDKTDFQEIGNSLDFINKIEGFRYRLNNRDNYYLREEDTTDEEGNVVPGKVKLDDNGKLMIDTASWKAATKKGSRYHLGVKAQDVYKALIETYGDDQYNDLVYIDDYENVKDRLDEDADDIKYSVNYNGFIPYLIESVKELSAKNDELENRLKAIESKLGL